jgi:hypothetical protein
MRGELLNSNSQIGERPVCPQIIPYQIIPPLPLSFAQIILRSVRKMGSRSDLHPALAPPGIKRRERHLQRSILAGHAVVDIHHFPDPHPFPNRMPCPPRNVSGGYRARRSDSVGLEFRPATLQEPNFRWAVGCHVNEMVLADQLVVQDRLEVASRVTGKKVEKV